MQKLNSNGFTHLFLVMAAVVIAGGMASFVIVKGHANSLTTTVAKGSDPDAYLCKKVDPSWRGKTYDLVKTGSLKSNGKAGPAVYKLFVGRGYWCAITIAAPSTYKESKPMSITLRSNLSGKKDIVAKQSDKYTYYAGPVYTPVSFTGAGIDHAKVTGTMQYHGKTYSATSSRATTAL